jgi:hypothetical protein
MCTYISLLGACLVLADILCLRGVVPHHNIVVLLQHSQESIAVVLRIRRVLALTGTTYQMSASIHLPATMKQILHQPIASTELALITAPVPTPTAEDDVLIGVAAVSPCADELSEP